MFCSARPNIFQFVDSSKRLQIDIYIKRRNRHLNNHAVILKQRKKNIVQFFYNLLNATSMYMEKI